MIGLRSYFPFLLAALFAGLSLSACKQVGFRNEVAGEFVDPAPFVDRWVVTEFQDNPFDDLALIEFRVEDGQARIVATQGSLTTEQDVSLTQLGSTTLVSLQDSFGFWHHFGIALEAGGQRMVLRIPDFDLVRQDVLDGTLAGKIKQLDLDQDDLILVESDSTTLSAHIAQRPEVFQGTFLLLTRQ